MKSKVKKRRLIYFILFNFTTILIYAFMLKCFYHKINFENIINLDFQYNIVTLAATIGGFLFTSISILISVIDKSSIKPYWENHYLDTLNLSAFFGIIMFLLVIILSVLAILFNVFREKEIFITIQVFLILVGFSNFGFSIKELIFVVRTLKKQS